MTSSKKFVLRIQTSQGLHRLYFSSNKSTFKELQSAIKDKYNINPEEQILSKDRPSVNPDFLSGDPNDTFSKLNFRHGDILWLVMGENHLKEYKNKLLKENPMKKSPHKQAKSVTLSTSKWVNDPKHKLKDTGPKHIPFHEFIEERQKKYAKQPWNIDPPKYDYRSKPYSNGIKFSELPANAVIKRQEYRHVDVISFQDSGAYKKFVSLWNENQSIQRAAYLIGRYELKETEDESNKSNSNNKNKNNKTTKKKKLMYANVYTLYIPPQKGHTKGVKLLKDPNEESVNRILNSMNLERVGWCITTLPRGGDKKYKGDIFMTGKEIATAARLQEKYKNLNTGYSRFVTLITHLGTKEPQGFQISDQGVAMMRYGLVGPDEDWGFMKVKEVPPKVYVPAVINENKRIEPGKTFLPDAFLVNVIATLSKKQIQLFKYVNFPADGGIQHLKKQLSVLKHMEYHNSLSDFNLIVYLPQVLNDLDLVCKIAKHVINKQRLDEKTRKNLSARFNNICGGIN